MDSQQPVNHIRVSANSQVKNLIRYANMLLKERNFRELNFKGLGGAIGKIVSTVEILRIVNPGLYQINKIETVKYPAKDETERLYPSMEVTLTLDEPTTKGMGFQDKLNEEERVKLFNLLNERRAQRPETETPTGEFRGESRGRGRGSFRGGRGAPRGGFRGGFRGEARGAFRGAPRGEFRGGEMSRGSFRGAPRGEFRGAPRGGFRGESTRGGSFRGAPRGDFRGAPRGEFRGGRGAPRGEFRGGRGAPRGEFRGGRGAPRGEFRGGAQAQTQRGGYY